MAGDPELVKRLYDMVGRELDSAREHVVILGRRTADEKIACFLLDLRARLGGRFGLSNEVPLPMSRQDIADYLGLTIETVSRIFTRFGREGILSASARKAIILDLAKLQSLAAW